MGVEEIQKINNLAKELLKHHIASSSEDAFARAELMVKGEAPSTAREDEVNQELRQLGLKINSIYSELVNLQSEFKSVKAEIDSLKRNMHRVVSEQKAPSQSSAAQGSSAGNVPIHVTASAKHDAETGQVEQSQARPRTGDYKEKDVAVEKFFYYGNNKPK